jgi:hypothetical protein
MSGTPELTVCIDPATGREVYAPTGETIDQVVTVVATPLAREEACVVNPGSHAQAAAPAWGLVGALAAVGACAVVVRHLARRVA